MTDIVSRNLWVEKYRPHTLDDMVLSDNYRETFDEYIKNKEIPHLLLYGPPGSGKTTLARILVKQILGNSNSSDLYKMNGSSSTGIDIIRDHVEEFLKTPTFTESTFKIVFIDEMDYLSVNSQAAMRNILETYYKSGRFVCTCNYPSKIIDPLQSRFQMFEFSRMPKEYIQKYSKDILEKENVKYDDNLVNKIITMFYPDIRKIVGILQSRTRNGVLEAEIKDLESNEKKVRSFITDLIDGIQNKENPKINSAINNTKKVLSQFELDFIGLYQDIFYDDNIPAWAKIIVNKYSAMHSSCMVPSMNFMAMMFEIIKIGTQYRDL